MSQAVHSFHIPVMGTGFTIDTPLKVARFGISSVVSLVDDKLIEQVRRHYSELYDEEYTPITGHDSDARSYRITAYLNFVDHIVQKQIRELKIMPFEKDNAVTQYFEMLSDDSELKREYEAMLVEKDSAQKTRLQNYLRQKIASGSIDVNIMTKLDRDRFVNGQKLSHEHADAMSALRGFANSRLHSSVVLSAGVNLQLFSYLETFGDFFADGDTAARKKVILKVSDFRSAMTQGKIFAKKGIWVSEFRIESGLNCGGHAFPGNGNLLGPVLGEFKQKREELRQILFGVYEKALGEKNIKAFSSAPLFRITAQGGIGTSAEDRFLLKYFELDGTGWGSPFLLVPEATTVDGETLEKLAGAGEDDIVLSGASPLGAPFHILKNCAGEETRKKRIEAGHPGSPCTDRYLALNTEMSAVPICTASTEYQRQKIEELQTRKLNAENYADEFGKIVEKVCLCNGLRDGAYLKFDLPQKPKPAPVVCPGPNLAYFSHSATLRQMVDHIYGKIDLLKLSFNRPNLFIKELRLYVDYFKSMIARCIPVLNKKDIAHFDEFKKNLLDGIEYYKTLQHQFRAESAQFREKFNADLLKLREELEKSVIPINGSQA